VAIDDKVQASPLCPQMETSITTDTALSWKNLSSPLQRVLPNGKNLSYVITSFTPVATGGFLGAPSHPFEATIRINICDKEEAESWLQQMMHHSKCTYQHSKGRAPGLKRVLFKVEMHCQHYKKKLTSNQQSKSALARCKNARKSLMHDVRNKKTECPSKLKLTVNVPTKRDKFSAYRSPFLVIHLTVLTISFIHDHAQKHRDSGQYLKKPVQKFLSTFQKVIQHHLPTTGMRL